MVKFNLGKPSKNHLNAKLKKKRLRLKGRELERKQELNRVLAANNVSQSMSGITGEGTPASISLESAKQIGTSEGMINLSEKLKRAQLRRQGAMARSTANVNATSTLLQGISSIAMLAASAGNDGPAPVEDKSFKKGS
jgi:hypothetical protein